MTGFVEGYAVILVLMVLGLWFCKYIKTQFDRIPATRQLVITGISSCTLLSKIKLTLAFCWFNFVINFKT
jgi:hypothetical protein